MARPLDRGLQHGVLAARWLAPRLPSVEGIIPNVFVVSFTFILAKFGLQGKSPMGQSQGLP